MASGRLKQAAMLLAAATLEAAQPFRWAVQVKTTTVRQTTGLVEVEPVGAGAAFFVQVRNSVYLADNDLIWIVKDPSAQGNWMFDGFVKGAGTGESLNNSPTPSVVTPVLTSPDGTPLIVRPVLGQQGTIGRVDETIDFPGSISVDQNVTLGNLGLGVVQSSAAGLLKSDFLIDDTLTMASTKHFMPTDASGQDLGDGTHRWDLYTQDVIFGGATGANVITVPDNFADAWHLSDAGGIEYMRVVSMDAQPVVVFNNAEADIDYRVAASGITNALFVQGSTGRVGVGTAAPASNLQILEDTPATAAAIQISAKGKASLLIEGNTDNSGNANAEIQFNIEGSRNVTMGVEDGVSNNPFIIAYDNALESRFMALSSTGLVGINTNIPEAMLHIKINSAAVKGLIIRPAANQSANIFAWTNSDATSNGQILADGTIDMNPPITATAGTKSVLLLKMDVNPGAASAASYRGFFGGPIVRAGNIQNITGDVIGLHSQPQHLGTGTIATMTGITSIVQNKSTGVLTDARASWLRSIENTGGGSVTNAYGLVIDDINVGGTLNYAIYTNAGGIWFNAGGDADTDLIVSGDTEPNLFRVDAGLDAVHIGDWDTNYVQIDEAGDVVFVGGAGLAYADIHAHAVAADLALAAENTFYQIVAFDTDGPSNNCTPSHANDHITIVEAGDYRVSLSWSGHAHNLDDYDIHVKTNNGTVDYENVAIHTTTAVAGRVITSAVTGLCAFSAADTVEIWVQRTTGGAVEQTLTTDAINLTVAQVGG